MRTVFFEVNLFIAQASYHAYALGEEGLGGWASLKMVERHAQLIARKSEAVCESFKAKCFMGPAQKWTQ